MSQSKSLDKKLILSLRKTKGMLPSLGQWKYLPEILEKFEKRLLLILLVIFIAAFLTLAAHFYFDYTDLRPVLGGAYSEGIVDTPYFINPIYASTGSGVDADITRLIFSGLLRRNASGDYEGDLVESFEVSADSRVYILRLRKSVFWHDGKEFNADDVLFTIGAIQDKKWQSPYFKSWENISIKKIDDFTVEFRLQAPFAPFLTLLSTGILPSHLWKDVTPQDGQLSEFNLKPVGAGPFKFQSLTKDKNGAVRSLTLLANKNYYRQGPFLERIVLKFFPDFISAVDALETKNIDGLAFLPPELEKALAGKNNFNFYSLVSPKYTAIFFNPKQNETLSQQSVREALAFAVPKQRILYEVLVDKGRVAESPLPQSLDSSSAEEDSLSFNLEHAKELLNQAGWEMSGEYRKKQGKELAITLATVEQRENVRAMQIIKGNWEAIGVKTNLEILSAETIFEEKIKPRAYEALLFGEIIGPAYDLFPFWHSSQIDSPGLNLALYSNRRADVLLEEAQQILNREEKQKKYLEFKSLLLKDLPAIFLWSPVDTYIVEKKIRGIEIGDIGEGADRFLNVENWYIKSGRRWKN